MAKKENITPAEEVVSGLDEISGAESTDTGKMVKKPRKLRNTAFLKRGGFALAITAAVLVGVVLLNILVGALSNRFHLDFDMSPQKVNTISKENKEFIKGVKIPVTITVCAEKDSYVRMLAQYSESVFNAAGDPAYFEQTVNLIEKYAEYNKNITLRFIDPQDPAFTEISTKYANDKVIFSDIIVSSGEEETERYKVVHFTDIYALSDESGYAAAGYGAYTISGNNIETVLTSAVAYAASSESKKVALLTGHSASNVYESYVETLKLNNYEIETISDTIVTKIPGDCDAVLIAAPTSDFLGNELDVISEFLENGGDLSKGLIVFTDATAPYLPNFYDFLEQWGITVSEGILFETNAGSHLPDQPTALGTWPDKDSLTSGMNYAVTGYNLPIQPAFESEGNITVTTLMSTTESVVAAPVGTPNNWDGAGNYEKDTYCGVIQSQKLDYNDDNEAISSFVMAFSSVEYIFSDRAESSTLSNKDISLAAMSRATGREDVEISFISKTITNESYAESVTEASTLAIKIIFIGVLPILTIAACIFIYIRRKNA